jgi:hypothetical protein
VVSSEREPKVISSEDPQRATPSVRAKAASTDQVEAVSIAPAVEADLVIWTARLRIDHVVIFQASDSKVFKAAALIVLAAEDSVVTARSVAEAALAVAIASALEDSAAAAALADSAAVGAGADGNIYVLDLLLISLTTKNSTNPRKTKI